jgi:hypothetical protein
LGYIVMDRLSEDEEDNNAIVFGRHRRLGTFRFAATFGAKTTWRWKILGSASDVRQVSNEQRVIEFLNESPGRLLHHRANRELCRAFGQSAGYLEAPFEAGQSRQDREGWVR